MFQVKLPECSKLQEISTCIILFYRNSSSRSRSPSPVNTATFITSFGGDSSDEDAVVQGPALPPHLQIKSSVESSSTKSLKRSALSRSVSLRFYSCQKVLNVESVTQTVPIALCFEHQPKTKQKREYWACGFKFRTEL